MVLDQAKTMKIASTLGWGVIVLFVLLMLASGANRLVLMTHDPATADALDVRYIQHPWVALLHIVPGVLFLTLAPLQFVARIRRRRISIHRGLGRILATCAAISGIHFSCIRRHQHSDCNGIFWRDLSFCAGYGDSSHPKKEVRQHREWMIRTFSLAMGVATVRVYFLLLGALTGLSFEETFGASFWLGFGTNLLVAEVWINHTRAAGRVAERA